MFTTLSAALVHCLWNSATIHTKSTLFNFSYNEQMIVAEI